eukprot:294302-Alexandrium_andersonii.AAC.1
MAARGHRGGEAVERLAMPPDLADGGLAALATTAERTRHESAQEATLPIESTLGILVPPSPRDRSKE